MYLLWESANLPKSPLSYHVSPQDGTQVIMCGRRHLCPLTYLPGSHVYIQVHVSKAHVYIQVHVSKVHVYMQVHVSKSMCTCRCMCPRPMCACRCVCPRPLYTNRCVCPKSALLSFLDPFPLEFFEVKFLTHPETHLI